MDWLANAVLLNVGVPRWHVMSIRSPKWNCPFVAFVPEPLITAIELDPLILGRLQWLPIERFQNIIHVLYLQIRMDIVFLFFRFQISDYWLLLQWPLMADHCWFGKQWTVKSPTGLNPSWQPIFKCAPMTLFPAKGTKPCGTDGGGESHVRAGWWKGTHLAIILIVIGRGIILPSHCGVSADQFPSEWQVDSANPIKRWPLLQA